MSIGKFLRIVGSEAAINHIKNNHSVEMGVSPTRRTELLKQLENSNAGPLAHLKCCPRCASDIETRALAASTAEAPLSALTEPAIA